MKGFVIDPLIRGLTGVRLRLSVLLPSLTSFLLSILVLFLAWSGLLYPLRPDVWSALDHPLTADPQLANAWGGPALIGAWFVHAMVALGLQTVCLWIIRVLNRRTAGARLGGTRGDHRARRAEGTRLRWQGTYQAQRARFR